MAIRNLKTIESGDRGKKKKHADEHGEADHDDACRCKEAAEMKPGELFRLMMSDLAFWKKTKKG